MGRTHMVYNVYGDGPVEAVNRAIAQTGEDTVTDALEEIAREYISESGAAYTGGLDTEEFH